MYTINAWYGAPKHFFLEKPMLYKMTPENYGKPVPEGTTTLEVYNCPAFAGAALPAGLTTLGVS
jgi:hypothetical protein